MRFSESITSRAVVAAALLTACASATQQTYIAPNRYTIVSTTEERQADPPSHLIYIENHSTVPVTVFSVSLTGCENVKQSCSPRPTNIRVGPGQRQLAIRVEPRNSADGFGYHFGFSWNADSSAIKALGALASSGNTRAQEQLGDIQRADSIDRLPRQPHYNELSRTDFGMLASRARSLRLSPDSLLLAPGQRAKLSDVHILLLDSAGVVLGQTQWLRYQLSGSSAVTFAPPATLEGNTPGRTAIRFRLAEEAQALLPRVADDDIELPVVVAFPTDPHAPTFEGIAVDADSKAPLGCARVSLADSSENIVASGRTDRAGTFVLRAPRAGTYAVHVEAFGWEPVSGPFEMAQPDEAKQHQYSVRFTDRLLSVGVRGLDDTQHAYPVAVTASAFASAPGAKAKKTSSAGPRAIVQSVSLRGSETMPILNVVSNAPAGTSWIEFTVDSAGVVDASSIVYPAGTDQRAIGSVNLVLPHVKFSPAREDRRPTCELLRMQVNFTPR